MLASKSKRKRIVVFVLIALYGVAGALLLFRYNEFKNKNALTQVSRNTQESKTAVSKSAFPVKKNSEMLNPFRKENKKASLFFEKLFSSMYELHYNNVMVRAFNYSTDELKQQRERTYFFVEVQKKLRYTSVNDLPFVKGMKAALRLTNSRKYAQQVFDKKVKELESYVGVVQTEYNILSVATDSADNFISESISLSTYNEVQSISCLKLPTDEQLIAQGKNFLLNAAKRKSSCISFDNARAVAYALRFSSNPKNANADKLKWNRQYSAYENDCANFVSQCLHAGGTAQTEEWHADSLSWIRTGNARTQNGGLIEYMQRDGKFFAVDYSAVSPGGFVSLTDESHVMLVSANDSVTCLYNGHTNDRSLFCLPHFDEGKAMYLTPNNYDARQGINR